MAVKGVSFAESETQAIRTARTNNPNVPQRKLAATLFNNNAAGTPGFELLGRTQASIYAAIRRFDKTNNPAKKTAKV